MTQKRAPSTRKKAIDSEKERFVVLDSWRGLCALLVALYHVPVTSFFFLNPLVRGSYLFVDFFFVLSGFVISFAYEGRIRDGATAAEFLVKRVGRLWPVHVVTLLAMLLLTAAVSWARHVFGRSPFVEAPASAERLIANVLLLNGFGVPGLTSINVPSWSISCELMVYTLFCVLLFFGRRAIALWVGIAILSAALIAQYSPLYMNATDVLGLARCAYGFGLGVAAKVLYLKYGRYLFSNTAIEAAAVALALCFVAFTHESPWSLLAPLVFFVVVLVFSLEAGGVSSLLNRPFFRLLGKLSFTIYMCHYIAVAGIYQLALSLRLVDFSSPSPFFGGHVPAIDVGGHLSGAAVALGYLAIVVLSAWALHLAVEEPFRKRAYAMAKQLRLRLQGAALAR